MIPCVAPIGEVPMWTIKNRPRYNRDKLRYPSDLTDAEWAYVEPLIPPAKHGGGKRRVDMRDVVNGVMYVLSTGCQWRYPVFADSLSECGISRRLASVTSLIFHGDILLRQ